MKISKCKKRKRKAMKIAMKNLKKKNPQMIKLHIRIRKWLKEIPTSKSLLSSFSSIGLARISGTNGESICSQKLLMIMFSRYLLLLEY